MAVWRRLGDIIAHNMVFLVPLCLVFGVCAPDAFAVLKPLVTPMFAFVTFQGSLGNNFFNLARTFRRPAPMLVAIAISQVLMPLMGWVLGGLLFSDPNIVAGIVLEYSVPIAVTSTMWIGIYAGDMSLALGTLLISTLISPVTIPATLRLLVGATVQVDAAGMFFDMLVMIALPALAATALNQATRGRVKATLSPALAPLARIFVILVITTNSTSLHDFMFNLTPELAGVMVFIAAMASSGYLWGFAATRLMHLEREQAVTLTFCSALRNISAGAVIAQAYFPAATMFPVMTGTLFNQFLAAVFGRVFSRAFSPDADKGNQPARDTEAPGADGSSPAHRPQGHESAA
ncbi:bile acid:sodium symporter family protein [Olsenella sp. AF16-14LB]|uniref:bile acid:sodium symporter family protein n=1 Tax=unclassified Olsenella TaxID=2638792 RepID=UPI000E496BA7|nr:MULTISPECIES: bile acid:sodium symporter family protein [unclassified Olsenella]RGU48704.1 bile acid:sodium symporter family protein [Olsenella sp. AF16-14LB]RGU80990.1 bile acid:sodium symporter family protein [Olsenella sp. AF15-43LB]